MTASNDNLAQSKELVSILGINVINLSVSDAVNLIETLLNQEHSTTHAFYIVNTHTLNLAVADAEYRDVLNNASAVFGDGTGVRWAARQRGVEMKDNLVGTDLIPRVFEATAGRGYRYFLLGADRATIQRATITCSSQYPGWSLAGFHHGFFNENEVADVVHEINATSPHLLLVGMGNPKQEKWINAHKHQLKVKVALGIGGLFDHWGGNLVRAPLWVRRIGFEWLQILLQQPKKKWRRYILGNPMFLWRMTRYRRADIHKLKVYTRRNCLYGDTLR